MPVIIDHLDLVDTEPDEPRAVGRPVDRPLPADVGRTLAALRTAAQREARATAD